MRLEQIVFRYEVYCKRRRQRWETLQERRERVCGREVRAIAGYYEGKSWNEIGRIIGRLDDSSKPISAGTARLLAKEWAQKQSSDKTHPYAKAGEQLLLRSLR